MDKQLEVSNLTMTYDLAKGEVLHALSDVSFTLEPGGLLSVLGPSGCGKTTMLNILAGFLEPTSGEAIFDNKVVAGPDAQRGMVFQQGALFEWVNVARNVGFGPTMRGLPKQEVNDLVEHWLEVVGLKGFGPKAIYELSGGMQQRVSLARCLANDPDLILMDEPLGALDALTRERMQGLILNLWKKTHKTIVTITHSVEEALLLGRRLFVMAPRPGRIVKEYKLDFCNHALQGNTRDVKKSAEFVEVREEVLALIWEMEAEIMKGSS